MLRLFLQIKDQRLKVREAFPGEVMDSPKNWQNQIEFQYVPDHSFMMIWTSLLPDLPAQAAKSLVGLVSARYPVSPDYFNLKKICPELVFPEIDSEWVFFGGSFNPWHSGHQSCLELLPADKTCFLIPDINPFKEAREIDAPAMALEINSRAIFRPNQHLVPTFLMDNKKNPTIEWIESLKKNFPQKKLSLLMGFDSFASITTWTRSADLLPLLHCLYVVSRLETDTQRNEVRKNIKGPEVQFLGRHQFEDLSSTKLRQK